MLVAITALKGGVGKTTTAVHLAAYLQTKGKTLLIDGDRNRSALIWSREEKLPFVVASQAGATSMIRNFNHIVMDMNARPELEDLQDLVKSSDLTLIPTTPNHLDIDATLKTVEILNSLGAKYRILLTKVDHRTRNGREAKKLLREHNLPLIKQDIPLLIAFERASQRGVIIKDYPDPRSAQAWRNYCAVAREIIQAVKEA